MRRCGIAPTSCMHRAAAPCCHDCGVQGCKTRCRNHPDRCKCWVDKPPVRVRVRKVDPDQAVWLYRQGWTEEEISEEFGCTVKTVRGHLRKAGAVKHG